MSIQTGRAVDVIACIEAQTEAAIQRLRRASTFREGLGELQGSGTVGGVSVTVNATGALLDIEFAPSVVSSGAQLRAVVLAAHRAAQRDVADRVGDRARETWGEDDPMVARLETDVALRTGPRLVR